MCVNIGYYLVTTATAAVLVCSWCMGGIQLGVQGECMYVYGNTSINPSFLTSSYLLVLKISSANYLLVLLCRHTPVRCFIYLSCMPFGWFYMVSPALLAVNVGLGGNVGLLG